MDSRQIKIMTDGSEWHFSSSHSKVHSKIFNFHFFRNVESGTKMSGDGLDETRAVREKEDETGLRSDNRGNISRNGRKKK